MIKFSESNILQIVPEHFKKSAEVQAIAYALQRMNQKLIAYAKRTTFISSINSLPEELLDLLAVELRTQYYTSDISVELKRKLISNTLNWYRIAGTPAAVEELIQVVFGVGNVTEWFDYEEGPGEPGTFDIETSAQFTPDIISDFTKIINKVKNTRSHIRKINIRREIEHPQYAVMVYGLFNTKLIISDSFDKVENIELGMKIFNENVTDVSTKFDDTFVKSEDIDTSVFLCEKTYSQSKIAIDDTIESWESINVDEYNGSNTISQIKIIV